MKTVTSTLLLATLVTGAVATAAPKMPDARLLDLYAIREADSYVVHIVANGDISAFLTDRKEGGDGYKLTVDVPALAPQDSKYEIDTPFSQGFQVWPMQLEKTIYSRIQIDLSMDASSVVGVLNKAHLFIRIQSESMEPPALVADSPPAPAPSVTSTSPETMTTDPNDTGSEPVAITALGVLPIESEDSDGPYTDSSADGAINEEELFFNLFPTPSRQSQTLFNVSTYEDTVPTEAVNGIRVGRFALQPSADFSYIRGNNLLLLNNDTFEDTALLARGRLVATLLESYNDLQFMYEGRYRDFDKFQLVDRYTHVFDVKASLVTSTRSNLVFTNHFIHGSFESQEFDPGGEVVANTDPFYRNVAEATYAMDVSERLGAELSGQYNRVEFTEPGTEFFSYDTSEFGGGIVYNLSPLTNLIGEFIHMRTRPDPTRQQARAEGNMVMFGIRGELTTSMRGQIRGGFASQDFGQGLLPANYRGFVADARVTRDFGQRAALDFTFGRRTTPSAFQLNGFYISNYATARFSTPVLLENLRFNANAAFFGNSYTFADVTTGIEREDDTLRATLGAAYFFTPLSYFSVDYRFDRRTSSIERFSFRNNAIHFMVGFGFLNR